MSGDITVKPLNGFLSRFLKGLYIKKRDTIEIMIQLDIQSFESTLTHELNHVSLISRHGWFYRLVNDIVISLSGLGFLALSVISPSPLNLLFLAIPALSMSEEIYVLKRSRELSLRQLLFCFSNLTGWLSLITLIGVLYERKKP